MRIFKVTCHAFRCLKEVVFEPSSGINVIRGRNAQGKTSLLEAILFASTSKSYRTNREAELVAHGERGFHIEVRAQRRTGDVVIESFWQDGVKRFKVNGIPQSRLSDILGKLHVVSFSPEDLALVKGGAANRRRFLDMALSQLYPAYLNALQQYRQVLRQRNELLKAETLDERQLDVWDAQLARYGPVLVEHRAEFITELAKWGAEGYAALAHGETLDMSYRPDVSLDMPMLDMLAENRMADQRRRSTQHGPHRDELEFLVSGVSARQFASQGQQKTTALAIKLAELGLFHERTGEYPVFMLDEVLSELDAERARRLFETIEPQVQCLLTTTELEARPVLMGADRTYFRIERGRIVKQ